MKNYTNTIIMGILTFISGVLLANNAPVGSTSTKSEVFSRNGAIQRVGDINMTIQGYQDGKTIFAVTWLPNEGPPINQTYSHSTSPIRDSDSAGLQNVVANCEATFGGVVETVTVPAGTFSTCKLQYDFANDPESDELNGTLWIGDAALGEIKAIWNYKDGQKYEYELKSYTWGPTLDPFDAKTAEVQTLLTDSIETRSNIFLKIRTQLFAPTRIVTLTEK